MQAEVKIAVISERRIKTVQVLQAPCKHQTHFTTPLHEISKQYNTFKDTITALQ